MDSNDQSHTECELLPKSYRDHAIGVSTHWKALLIGTLSTLGALWLVVEFSNHFLELDFKGQAAFLVIAVLSIIAGVSSALLKYVKEVPDGFHNESNEAQRIAHLQPLAWEFQLARQLFRDKLTKLDKVCEELIEWRVYVPAKSPENVESYIEWLQRRPENLMRMVEVALRLLIHDLPVACKSSDQQKASPKSILEVADQIRSLYSETVAFEREGHAMRPPDLFTKVHDLQLGWAASIRDAVHQAWSVLDRCAAIDCPGKFVLNCVIEFQPPSEVEQFCAQLELLAGSFPMNLDDGEEL